MPHPTGQTPPTATLLYLVPCRKPHVCMTLRCTSHAGCHDVLLTVFIVPSTPPHSTGCKGACYGACHKARHVSFTVNHVGSGLRPLDRPVGAPFRPPCVVNHGARLLVCPWGVTWRESVSCPMVNNCLARGMHHIHAWCVVQLQHYYYGATAVQ